VHFLKSKETVKLVFEWPFISLMLDYLQVQTFFFLVCSQG